MWKTEDVNNMMQIMLQNVLNWPNLLGANPQEMQTQQRKKN